MVCWEKYSSKCSIEGRMVKVGRDSDGSTLVVARAWKDNELIPCKARPTQGIAFCASGNREYNVYRYEILMMDRDEYQWVKINDLKIPNNAIVGGHTKEGDPLYIGRTTHDGYAVAGKVTTIYF
uniref:ProS protein n=1 Tax=Fopius arisanus TaxID=64838 RepID=A0A0C9Q6X6_9HYME